MCDAQHAQIYGLNCKVSHIKTINYQVSSAKQKYLMFWKLYEYTFSLSKEKNYNLQNRPIPAKYRPPPSTFGTFLSGHFKVALLATRGHLALRRLVWPQNFGASTILGNFQVQVSFKYAISTISWSTHLAISFFYAGATISTVQTVTCCLFTQLLKSSSVQSFTLSLE